MPNVLWGVVLKKRTKREDQVENSRRQRLTRTNGNHRAKVVMRPPVAHGDAWVGDELDVPQTTDRR